MPPACTRLEQAGDPGLHMRAEQRAERTESEHGKHRASPDRLAPPPLRDLVAPAASLGGPSEAPLWVIRRERLLISHRRDRAALRRAIDEPLPSQRP